MSLAQHYSDRRAQVELAARAVGYMLTWAADQSMCWLDGPYDGRPNVDDAWIPDSGWHDAFSLAAQLGLKVEWSQGYHEACASCHWGGRYFSHTVGHGPSRGAAQQAAVHAIFHVAVDIGRFIKQEDG